MTSPQVSGQMFQKSLHLFKLESSQKPAPVCELGRFINSETFHEDGSISGAQVPSGIHCRCTKEPVVKGLDGNPKGGCVPPRE